jgi:hypothetical protein
MTKQEVQEKILKWAESFKHDPADSDYQLGYEAALLDVVELFDD